MVHGRNNYCLTTEFICKGKLESTLEGTTMHPRRRLNPLLPNVPQGERLATIFDFNLRRERQKNFL